MSSVLGIQRVLDGDRELVVALAEDGPRILGASLRDLLSADASHFHAGVDAPGEPVPEGLPVLRVVDQQEVWASGVTYARSREARIAESDSGDVYQRVYDAERPELFFKAPAWRVPSPGAALRLRSDSAWDVPEPELALVLTASGDIVGYLVANDMSSRTIEAENPLYLPQAKTFDDAIGLSDTIVLARTVPTPEDLTIALTIERDGRRAFNGETSTSSMHRSFEDLRDHLFRELSFPSGAVLLTGTGLVPPDDFTLQDGDTVTIEITGVGRLSHPVYRSEGRQAPQP